MSKSTSFEELSEIIVSAIREEPFFTKEVLIPKVKAIIRGFRINLSTAKYDAIEKPTDTARRLRELEKLELEKTFWQRKVKNLVGDKIDGYYHELDSVYEQNGFPNRSVSARFLLTVGILRSWGNRITVAW